MTGKQTEERKNDWLLKVLAVVFAVMLWFYADAEQNPMQSRQFDIPVQYENQAEDYIIGNGPQSVRVTIRGKSTDLSSLRSDDFTAVVDLADAETGNHEYEVQVQAPNVVERFSYMPDRLMLTIDQVQTKEVPIHVRTTGALSTGYQLTSTEVLPETVVIAGLSQVLENISEIETDVVDISALTSDTTQEIGLRVMEGVTLKSAQQVAVRFLVQQEEGQGSHEAVIALRNVPEDLLVTLSQQTAVVHVNGSAALLEDQSELNQIQLFVDGTGLTVGQHQLPIQVSYNGALQLSSIEPSVVTVTVEATQPTGVVEPIENNESEEEPDSSHDEGDMN